MNRIIQFAFFTIMEFLPYTWATAQVTSPDTTAVDVHCHLLPTDYIDHLRQHDALLEEGFPLPKWDVTEQLRWMDEAGIGTAVLTLAAPQPHGAPKENAAIVRRLNEEAARIKVSHPGRFKFCATLPLPDVQAAIDEAIYALDVLHADGIKLATNVRGQYLGVPELDTLMAVLNARRAIVILHPHKPDPVNETVMQQTPLAMQEYLSETTRAVANMITRNVPARYPALRIVVPHCGAYLPMALPRMKALTPVMQQNGLVGAIDWERNLAGLYYDLAGAHSPEVIRLILSLTTPDHLLYGSDFPYAAPHILTASLRRMKQYLSDEPDLAPWRDAILCGNAHRLFGDTTASQPNVAAKTMIDSFLLVRLAEIEVYPEAVNTYMEAAHRVMQASLAEERGVICLFPNRLKEDATRIRILEVYASDEAYRHHITTPHFLRYKAETQAMVKSLVLHDLTPVDSATIRQLFARDF
jgi:amidohydrolase 2